MSAANVRRAFMVLHLALGLGLLTATLETALHALREHGGLTLHLGLVVVLEGVGAILFLIPRTLRVGAVTLLVVLLGGSAVHLTRGEIPTQLLVYAAGVWFVMVHGAAWGAPSPGSDPSA